MVSKAWHRLLYLMLFFSVLSCAAQDAPPAKQQPDAPATPNDQRPVEDPNAQLTTLEKVRVLPAEWLIGPYIPSDRPLQPLTLRERREAYLRQTFLNAGAYLARMFTGGIDHARRVPPEWGGGMDAYGLRFGSRYGQFVIASTLESAGYAVLGYEPRYDLCKCSGFWPRTKHAFARNFYTYNRTEREKRPAIPLYVSAFAAGAMASVWTPGHRRAWKDGLYAAIGQAGYGMGINWVSEFALDILHVINKKRYPLPRK
jgi:hypothetical protein